MKLVDKLVAASTKSFSARSRLVARVLPVIVFFFIFPTLLFLIPRFVMDNWFQMHHFFPPIVRVVIGPVLIILGVIFLFWTMKAQREIGRGTPMPLVATQKLVVNKPYSYCRNPLFFGLINFYFGISIMIDSVSSFGMVTIFSLIIMLYIKLIEEKELEIRFGNQYTAYKKKTSFIIPRRPQD
jgi:protein-S-isoprenylcysteine O-methyltransferase Ste14